LKEYSVLAIIAVFIMLFLEFYAKKKKWSNNLILDNVNIAIIIILAWFSAYLFYIENNPIIFILSFFSLIIFFAFKIFSYRMINNKLKIESVNDSNTNSLLSEGISVDNAKSIKNIWVKEIMIPRMDISSVSIDDDISKIRNLFITSGHSRIVVYRDTIDNVLGYIHISDFLLHNPKIARVIKPLLVIPEFSLAEQVLKNMIEKRKYFAIVVDEFGGTEGLITIEDLTEQIVGDIEDEHDYDDDIELNLNNGEILVSGSLAIKYLNDTYFLNLPENENYETLAGFIFYLKQDIPKINEEILFKDLKFQILNIQKNRIEEVKIINNHK
jgi:CBS domain containing-hemolysin-like protein